MSNLIGHSLGRYHILEQLGEGGMAVVYKARDTRLEADVAVKVIRTENILPSALERTLKRFEREAKALARLTHPNIVKVTDYGEHENKPYLVMSLFSGGTLKSKLGGKPMPWQDAIQILLPIADALGYAHKHDIIHRDVKPANILIAENGQPMLADFGVAKILDVEETMELTGTGVGIGTPEYMAPEQGSSKVIDHRADIYALGVVFYEMVTGRKPYTADTPLAVLIKRASEPLPRPRQFIPSLPQAVENVIVKSLAKKPEDRYQSMTEFAKAMNQTFLAYQVRLPKAKPLKRSSAPKSLKKAVTPLASWVWISGGVALLLALTMFTAAKWFVPSPAVANVTTETQIPLEATIDSTNIAVTMTATPMPSMTKTPNVTTTPLASPSPALKIGSTITRISDKMVMKYVPEGNFTMGSPDDIGNSNEHPQHNVYLDAFWMDETEVTNGKYEMCVQAGVCQPPHLVISHTQDEYYGNPRYASHPVIYVDWSQANTYCVWTGSRLPTEAEWEKAARGTTGRTYPLGEVIDCDKAAYCGGDTLQVGNYYESDVSPYKIYDMTGNVKEWVADWYESAYYSDSPLDNPQGPDAGQSRVVRGGSWDWPTNRARRSAYRYWFDPTLSNNAIGFRCARSAP